MNREFPFKPGTLVKCPAFKQVAEVVSQPNRKNEVQVRLGHLSLWIPLSSLEIAETFKKKQPKKQQGTSALFEGDPRQRVVTIDLHGQKVAEALELLERTIDRAIIHHTEKIEIIHGFGTGAIKHAVDSYLASCKHIARFEIDERNRGTTWAFLD